MFSSNRGLIVVRVSKHDGGSHYSPATQRQQGERYAKKNGVAILPEPAEDLSVSASIPPEQRRGLGPWLTDRFHEWDILILSRTDRVSRDMYHSVMLDRWCQDNGKALFIADYDLQLDYRPGADKERTRKDKRDFLNRSMSAMEEYEKIKDRNLETHAYSRALDIAPGGSLPFGYTYVPHPTRDGAKAYGVDEGQKAIANRAADLLLNGMSWHEIASTLDREGLKPPGRKGIKTKGIWHGQAIRRILKSPASMGMKTTRVGVTGEVPEGVTDENGIGIRLGDPLFTQERWIEIQTEIARRALGPQTRTKGAAPLLNIVVCRGCNRNLYRKPRGNKAHEHYHCIRTAGSPACPGYSFRSVDLFESLDFAVQESLSDIPEIVREFRPGEDSTRDLVNVRKAIASLNDRYFSDMTNFPGGEAEYERLSEKLAKQEKVLAAKPQRADEFVETETGRVISELYFGTDDLTERRRILLTYGIKLYCGPTPEQSDQYGHTPKNTTNYKLYVPEPLLMRAKSYKPAALTVVA